MNPLIRELVHQSIEVEDNDDDLYRQEKFNKETFARLIVEECARIAELKEQGYSLYDKDISVGWYMKQHFGLDCD